MFHMLSCFNLKPEIRLEEFRQSVAKLDVHLRNIDLIHSIGPIGRRQKGTILDTDSDRQHEFFFVTSFRDRAQSDRAVRYMTDTEDPLHIAVYSNVKDPIFICWEDL